MNEKTAPAGELSEKQLNIIGSPWHFNLLVPKEKAEVFTFARAVIAADRALRASPAVGDVPYAPNHCPITGEKFWGNIEHPSMGMIATYGGPFDTYTIPTKTEEGELRRERFCQDRGAWVDSDPLGWFYEDQQTDAHAALAAKDADIATLTAERDALLRPATPYMTDAFGELFRLSDEHLGLVMQRHPTLTERMRQIANSDAAMTKEPK